MRSIRKELEEINMGVALREGEEREEVEIFFFSSFCTALLGALVNGKLLPK